MTSTGGNEIVSIHLKSQSCTTITPSVRTVSASLRQKDCATIYVGKIRRVTHTDEKVTIQLEDLTEQKLHKIFGISNGTFGAKFIFVKKNKIR